jgi:heme exporter protein C
MGVITRYASPKYFLKLSNTLIPWCKYGFIVLGIIGLYWSFFVAPTDAVQGEAYRIIFVHVPAAWMSLMVYASMTLAAITVLIWRTKVSEYWLLASPEIGASFTFIALATGSLWGKPMWGTYWVWDARLTSELILLFIYLAIISVKGAINDPRKAARVVAMITIIGAIDLPIIKFSVDWWTTLHQPASVFRADGPTIHYMMLIGMALMAFSFLFYYMWLTFKRVNVFIGNKG